MITQFDEKKQIEDQLAKLTPFNNSAEPLKKLADFLANITMAWDEANNERRNKLARCLFQEVWVKDKEVVAVKPQSEFEPFFKLNWEEFSKEMKSRGQSPPGSPDSFKNPSTAGRKSIKVIVGMQ